jgi:hypothetical protein
MKCNNQSYLDLLTWKYVELKKSLEKLNFLHSPEVEKKWFPGKASAEVEVHISAAVVCSLSSICKKGEIDPFTRCNQQINIYCTHLEAGFLTLWRRFKV